MGARNQVGIGSSYRPAGLHRLAESIPGFLKSLKIRALFCALGWRNRFLVSLKVYKFGLCLRLEYALLCFFDLGNHRLLLLAPKGNPLINSPLFQVDRTRSKISKDAMYSICITEHGTVTKEVDINY
jgi:hypothetical protein